MGATLAASSKRNADIQVQGCRRFISETFKLRRNLEDDALVLSAAILGGPIELALIQYQVAERVKPIFAAGESVEQRVIPRPTRGRQLIHRTGIVVAVTMGCTVKITGR